MLKNLVDKKYHEVHEYYIEFNYDKNSGFSFPCDEKGNIISLNPAAKENYEWCLQHPEKFEQFNKITCRNTMVIDYAHGTCSCGREVELYNQYQGACQCECGQWYNLFGQELINPEFWESDEEV